MLRPLLGRSVASLRHGQRILARDEHHHERPKLINLKRNGTCFGVLCCFYESRCCMRNIGHVVLGIDGGFLNGLFVGNLFLLGLFGDSIDQCLELFVLRLCQAKRHHDLLPFLGLKRVAIGVAHPHVQGMRGNRLFFAFSRQRDGRNRRILPLARKEVRLKGGIGWERALPRLNRHFDILHR